MNILNLGLFLSFYVHIYFIIPNKKIKNVLGLVNTYAMCF